jgi:hypothetical protein
MMPMSDDADDSDAEHQQNALQGVHIGHSA